MTIAFWCILIACLLPMISVLYAKFLAAGAKLSEYDNNSPREYLAKLEGSRKRAVWSEQNTHESLPLFIAGVLVAHFTGAEQATINILSLSFIGFRLAYIVVYIADYAVLRSLIWAGGLLCSISLFAISA